MVSSLFEIDIISLFNLTQLYPSVQYANVIVGSCSNFFALTRVGFRSFDHLPTTSNTITVNLDNGKRYRIVSSSFMTRFVASRALFCSVNSIPILHTSRSSILTIHLKNNQEIFLHSSTSSRIISPPYQRLFCFWTTAMCPCHPWFHYVSLYLLLNIAPGFLLLPTNTVYCQFR